MNLNAAFSDAHEMLAEVFSGEDDAAPLTVWFGEDRAEILIDRESFEPEVDEMVAFSCNVSRWSSRPRDGSIIRIGRTPEHTRRYQVESANYAGGNPIAAFTAKADGA